MRSTHTASMAGAAVMALALLLASCGGGDDVTAAVEDAGQGRMPATEEPQLIDGWVEVRPEPNLPWFDFENISSSSGSFQPKSKLG